jgi:hypothetical protein
VVVPLVGDGIVEYKENKLGIVFNNNDIVHKTAKKGKISTQIMKKRLVSSLAEGVAGDFYSIPFSYPQVRGCRWKYSLSAKFYRVGCGQAKLVFRNNAAGVSP